MTSVCMSSVWSAAMEKGPEKQWQNGTNICINRTRYPVQSAILIWPFNLSCSDDKALITMIWLKTGGNAIWFLQAEPSRMDAVQESCSLELKFSHLHSPLIITRRHSCTTPRTSKLISACPLIYFNISTLKLCEAERLQSSWIQHGLRFTVYIAWKLTMMK